MIGKTFNHHHAAGITRYIVKRKHRDCGYFICVAIGAIEGTHHFLGGIEIFSREKIVSKIANNETVA